MRRDYSKDIPERAMDAHWYMCMQVHAHVGAEAPLNLYALVRSGILGCVV